jgi:hypothetical protein
MHEAGAVGRALEAALRAGPPGAAAPRAATLVVTDPAHIAGPAAELHLQVHLAEHGFGDIPITTSVRPVTCAACGAESVPEPSDPFCGACGWPLPAVGVPGVEIGLAW